MAMLSFELRLTGGCIIMYRERERERERECYILCIGMTFVIVFGLLALGHCELILDAKEIIENK